MNTPYTEQRTGRRTVYAVDAIGPVATVRYQGGWVVRLEWADGFESRRVATRDYAEALAQRHATTIGGAL
jgi:hypothetical protein